MKFLLIFCFYFLILSESLEYVVLVAGSKGYNNARHQNDICHMYQIARKNGIPDEQIINMMYDDIAYNKDNPLPGQLFNAPSGVGKPAIDVYPGCPKDYTKENVTAAQFLAVLTGNKEIAKGKILKSTENDTVFIYYSDHGGVELLSFPSGPYLYASELIQAFDIMNTKRMYGRIAMYVEACFSGSMFENLLPPNISIYALTAANPDESSYAYYCPPDDDYVDGVPLGTCLADEFSKNFLQDDDRTKSNFQESLEIQFLKVRQGTKMSHVMQYGDMEFIRDPISEFISNDNAFPMHNIHIKDESIPSVEHPSRAINVYDVSLHLAYYNYLRALPNLSNNKLLELTRDLLRNIWIRTITNAFFVQFLNILSLPLELLTQIPKPGLCGECCELLFRTFQSRCLHLFSSDPEYPLRYGQVFKNICQLNITTAYSIVPPTNWASEELSFFCEHFPPIFSLYEI